MIFFAPWFVTLRLCVKKLLLGGRFLMARPQPLPASHNIYAAGPYGRRNCLSGTGRILCSFVSYDRGAVVEECDFDVAQLIRLHFATTVSHCFDDFFLRPYT